MPPAVGLYPCDYTPYLLAESLKCMGTSPKISEYTVALHELSLNAKDIASYVFFGRKL